MLPGLRLRQVRERLGLTYRDVERISYELASRRGRPEFVLQHQPPCGYRKSQRRAQLALNCIRWRLHIICHPIELLAWYERAGGRVL